MRNRSRLFYIISLCALILFLISAAFFGVSATSQPFAFETLALLIFLPLAIALWLDYRRRVVRPVWLFWIALLVSLLCAVHIYLLAALLV